MCGTAPYAAPEVLRAPAAPYRAPPADLWAAALVLLAMLAGGQLALSLHAAPKPKHYYYPHVTNTLICFLFVQKFLHFIFARYLCLLL